MTFVFPIPDEDTFETLATQLLSRIYDPVDPAVRYGRRGQKQHGVDTYLVTRDGRKLGGQSKRYVKKKLTTAILDDEVRKAQGFQPALDAYVFVTSAERDTKLSDHARSLRLHGRDIVTILFWEDVCDLLIEYSLCGPLLAQFPPFLLVEGLRRQGFRLDEQLVLDTAPLDQSTPLSPLEKQAADWIERGQTDLAIAALTSPGVRLTSGMLLNLLRAYMQRGDHAGAVACAAAAVLTPRQEAIVGLAHARMGDGAAARRCLLKASAEADPEERGYVFALELSVQLALGQADYAQLSASVPTSLANHTAVLGALGDAAMAEARYADAHAHYAAAEAASGPANWTRRVAVSATQLAQLMADLPAAVLVVQDGPLRQEIEAIAAALGKEDGPDLDPRSRRLLSHYRGLAAGLLGDGDGALRHARDAAEAMPNDHAMWRRWVYVQAAFQRPLDRAFAAAAPSDDPAIQMMLSDLEDRDGDREAARARIEGLLVSSRYDPGADPPTHARLLAQQILFQHEPGPLTTEQGKALLALAGACSQPAPGIIRLISHLNEPAIEPLSDDLFAWLQTSDLAGLDDEDQVALAAMAQGQGHAVRLERFIPVLRRFLSREDGPLDESIAGILVEILIARHRFQAAAAITTRWLDTEQRSPRALYFHTRILVEQGELEAAHRAFADHPTLTASHAALMRSFVSLAGALGRLRDAKRAVESWPLPRVTSASDLQSLYFVLAAIGDKRRMETLAIESLAPGTPLEQAAGALFGITIRYVRPEQKATVRMNCVVTLETPKGETFEYWVGDHASPIQGVATAGWALPEILGRHPGDTFEPRSGQFAGTALRLMAVKQPLRILLDQAERLGRAAGSLEAMTGDTDTLVEDMRARLLAHRNDIDRRMEAVDHVPVPAISMGSALNTSPRMLLRASGRWVPKSHSGAQEELDHEKEVLGADPRFVIDAATVCLIVELDLEPLIATFSEKPTITAETERSLFDWYMTERESARAQGNMGVAPDGRSLHMQTYGPVHRKAVRSFWKRVARFVQTGLERAPRASDDVRAEFADFAPPFDLATLSSIAAAKPEGMALLSDELGVRGVARAYNIPAVSFRAVLDRARATRSLPLVHCTRMFAALAATGRTFLALPFATFACVTHLPSGERTQTMKALASTLAKAAPLPLWAFFVHFLTVNAELTRRNHRKGMSPGKLAKLLFRMMPKMSRVDTIAFLRLLNDDGFLTKIHWDGQKRRTAVRAVKRTLARHLRRMP
jgi:tetratricopeptide (TPR) repeat protein